MKVDIQYVTYAKLDFELETHFSCSVLTTRQRFSFKRDLGLRVGTYPAHRFRLHQLFAYPLKNHV